MPLSGMLYGNNVDYVTAAHVVMHFYVGLTTNTHGIKQNRNQKINGPPPPKHVKIRFCSSVI